MSRYANRQPWSYARFVEAKRIVTALTEAAKTGNGVYAPDLPGHQPYRTNIMQRLREIGLPVMARKAGRSSIWFIVSMFDADTQKILAEEWNRRVLQHHSAEACRGFMALTAHPHTQAGAQMFQRHAVEIGSLLGLDLTSIIGDLTPTTMNVREAAEFGTLVAKP